MNANTSHQVKVGLFVAVAVFLGMLSILLIGADRFLFKSYNRYTISFENVQGLAVGSVVSFSGINIGNISKIDMNPNSNGIVLTIDVEATYANRITENTIAGVKTQGALGDKYIFLDPGSPGTPLENGAMIQAKKEKDIFDLFSEKSAQFATMGDVIEEVHILLKSINKDGNTAKTLRNLAAASSHLNEVLGGMKDKKGNLNQSLQSLSSILKKIDDNKGTLGALINDPSVHDRILKILGDKPRNQYLTPLIRATIKNSENQSR